MATTEKEYTSTIEWLREKVEEFLVANPHIKPKQFGWRAAEDITLVARLRGGGDVTTKKLDRIIAYMAEPNQKKEVNHE